MPGAYMVDIRQNLDNLLSQGMRNDSVAAEKVIMQVTLNHFKKSIESATTQWPNQ